MTLRQEIENLINSIRYKGNFTEKNKEKAELLNAILEPYKKQIINTIFSEVIPMVIDRVIRENEKIDGETFRKIYLKLKEEGFTL
jgi:hypothetical protein